MIFVCIYSFYKQKMGYQKYVKNWSQLPSSKNGLKLGKNNDQDEILNLKMDFSDIFLILGHFWNLATMTNF